MMVRPESPAAERLLDLLPQIFRMRDRDEAVRIANALGFPAPGELADTVEGPLASLLKALGRQLDLLEAEIDWLYEDQFIETCADWVVPYIGALVGARIIDLGDAQSARRQVADTIRNRRGKGTARALADRAEAVFGRPAEAIEYGQYIVQTFNPNFPGETTNMTAAVNGPAGRRLGVPSAIGQHLVEVRDMREGGRFAPTNAGARVWTTFVYEHREVVPSPVAGGADGRYRFDPLGRDLALWSRGGPRNPDRARLEARDIPGPIALVEAVDAPDAFYGTGDRKSISIRIAGTTQPINAVCFCDLADDPVTGGWNDRGSPDEKSKIRIDPGLGRFVLPTAGAGVTPDTLRVRYRIGFDLRIGGVGRTEDIAGDESRLAEVLGDRDRRPSSVSFSSPRVVPTGVAPANAAAELKTALDGLDQTPAVRIAFGGTLATPATTTLAANTHGEVRGGDEVWPTITIASSWVVKGAGSALTLRGLRFAGGDLVIKAGISQLTIIDCTFVPGSARILIEEPDCKLLAVRSILGRIRCGPPVEIDLLDCVLDSGDADIAVIAALDDTVGGILWAERSTIIGDVRLLAIDEVSDCVFAERPTRSVAGASVSVQRTQSGCVRYSAVPRGSAVPRRYRCFPAEGDTTSPAPVFASLDYGEASYATLVAANPDPLLLGAENHGEMGAGNRISVHRRKRLLDADLFDWVPFGMATATELASE